MPPSAALPPGWRVQTSRSSGEEYYVNEYTEESTYEVPTGPAAAPSDEPPVVEPAPAPAPGAMPTCVGETPDADVPEHIPTGFTLTDEETGPQHRNANIAVRPRAVHKSDGTLRHPSKPLKRHPNAQVLPTQHTSAHWNSQKSVAAAPLTIEFDLAPANNRQPNKHPKKIHGYQTGEGWCCGAKPYDPHKARNPVVQRVMKIDAVTGTDAKRREELLEVRQRELDPGRPLKEPEPSILAACCCPGSLKKLREEKRYAREQLLQAVELKRQLDEKYTKLREEKKYVWEQLLQAVELKRQLDEKYAAELALPEYGDDVVPKGEAGAIALAEKLRKELELEPEIEPESVPRSPPPATLGGLPAGWEQHVSRSTGEAYYVNTLTQMSMYERPPPAGWEVHWEKRVRYVNAVTHEWCYERPHFPVLPPGWMHNTSRTSGEIYYVDPQGVSSYDAPAGAGKPFKLPETKLESEPEPRPEPQLEQKPEQQSEPEPEPGPDSSALQHMSTAVIPNADGHGSREMSPATGLSALMPQKFMPQPQAESEPDPDPDPELKSRVELAA
jgi:hypothetical protein